MSKTVNTFTIFDTHNFNLTACERGGQPSYMLTFKDCRDALLIGGEDVARFEDAMLAFSEKSQHRATVDDVLGYVWGLYVPLTVEARRDQAR